MRNEPGYHPWLECSLFNTPRGWGYFPSAIPAAAAVQGDRAVTALGDCPSPGVPSCCQKEHFTKPRKRERGHSAHAASQGTAPLLDLHSRWVTEHLCLPGTAGCMLWVNSVQTKAGKHVELRLLCEPSRFSELQNCGKV